MDISFSSHRNTNEPIATLFAHTRQLCCRGICKNGDIITKNRITTKQISHRIWIRIMMEKALAKWNPEQNGRQFADDIFMSICSDSAKLVSPRSSTDEKVGGPVKSMGRPIKLLYITAFKIGKSCKKSIFGPVKHEKLSRCLFVCEKGSVFTFQFRKDWIDKMPS